MMLNGRSRGALAALAVAGLAGCGGGNHKAIPQGVDGAVIFRDALDDNHNGWLDAPQAPFRGGVWVWNDVPPANVSAAPDALRAKPLPAGVAVTVRVNQRRGAALRMVSCRESGANRTHQHAAYQLGIDGRQALIRLWREVGEPPQVLARKPLAIANGRTVTLNGRCVPQGSGIALTLLVDGKVAAQSSQDKALANGDVGLHATARADTTVPPSLTWDDFAVRAVKPAGS
jgi:hypothetical protein